MNRESKREVGAEDTHIHRTRSGYRMRWRQLASTVIVAVGARTTVSLSFPIHGVGVLSETRAAARAAMGPEAGSTGHDKSIGTE
jgi:hypothetical protein